MNESLGWNATDIDASTAIHHIGLFNHSNGFSTFCEVGGQGLTTFAEPDNNSIKSLHISIII
jgi:hypothetical protein